MLQLLNLARFFEKVDMRKALWIVVLSVIATLSCKKAEPIRSSSKKKEDDTYKAEEKDVLAIYKLVKYSLGWQVPLTGNAIGFKMSVYFYRDSTFKKHWSGTYSAVELKGIVKDTIMNGRMFLLLKYANVISSPGSDNPLYYNIRNNQEIFFPSSATILVSADGAIADGPSFEYEKQ